MNDIPSGAIVIIVAVATIFVILFYGYLGDMLAKRQRKAATIEQKNESVIDGMWRQLREQEAAHGKRMDRIRKEGKQRARRDVRRTNRRRFLGSHR